MIWVFPSGDVHLVTASQMTAALRVVVLIPKDRTGAWSDASTVNDLAVGFLQVPPSDAGVTHAIAGFTGSRGTDPGKLGPATAAIVSPSATPGTSFHAVVAKLETKSDQTDSGGEQADTKIQQVDTGIIRVTTHADVTALAAGDHSLSAFAGEADRVITVYARFTDGAFEDVTGHPWLSYHPANAAIATVDSEGRIHAVAPGVTSVQVTTWDGRFGFTVPIAVRPALSAGLGATLVTDELSRRTARHKATLFVLAEGYQDRTRFFDRARIVTRAMFQSRPFNRLSDRFHTIGVFQPSPERGLTIGPRVLSRPGLSADERALWTNAPPAAPVERLFTRDTLFGLIVSGRSASTPRLARNGAAGTRLADFLAPREGVVEVSPDDRRLPRFGLDSDTSFEPIPPDAAFASTIRRYLAAAGHTFGPDDRVAFLADDEYYGGLKLEVLGIPLNHLPMVAFPTGWSTTVHGVSGTAPVLDRAPVEGTFLGDVVGSRLAHELAHTYRLGDEYEGDTSRIYAGNPKEIEGNENVQHDSTLRLAGQTSPLRGDPTKTPPLPPSGLDVTRIKWNVHRIAKLSAARAIAAVGSNARLSLERGQAKRWTAGERVFVRNSLVTVKAPTEPRTVAVAVQVITRDLAADTVDITLPPSFAIATLGEVPLLYVPKRNGAGVDLGLIDPVVLAYLAAHGPFPKPANQATWFQGNQDPPAIAGFSPPSVKADAIGLHEGGVSHALDVFRPSGRCKMRNPGSYDAQNHVTFDGFCFVCQYVLVELLDPAKHEALDADYPRDC